MGWKVFSVVQVVVMKKIRGLCASWVKDFEPSSFKACCHSSDRSPHACCYCRCCQATCSLLFSSSSFRACDLVTHTVEGFPCVAGLELTAAQMQ
eukprot:6109467-Amphidinium_carterae.1